LKVVLEGEKEFRPVSSDDIEVDFILHDTQPIPISAKHPQKALNEAS
jgi:hypothetical protein